MNAAEREALIASLSAEAAPDEATIRTAAAMVSEIASEVLARLEAAAGGALPCRRRRGRSRTACTSFARRGGARQCPRFSVFLTQAAPAASYALTWDVRGRAATMACALFGGNAEMLFDAVAHPAIGEMGCGPAPRGP